MPIFAGAVRELDLIAGGGDISIPSIVESPEKRRRSAGFSARIAAAAKGRWGNIKGNSAIDSKTAKKGKQRLSAVGLFLPQAILRAPNPKGKTPGAGRRVNVERRGQQGEQYIDATTGDIQLNQDSRASLPARLRP